MSNYQNKAEQYKYLLVEIVSAKIKLEKVERAFLDNVQFANTINRHAKDLQKELNGINETPAEELLKNSIKNKSLDIRLKGLSEDDLINDLIKSKEDKLSGYIGKIRGVNLVKALNIKSDLYYTMVDVLEVEKLGVLSEQEFENVIEIMKNDTNMKKKLSVYKIDNPVLNKIAKMCKKVDNISIDNYINQARSMETNQMIK